jgi:hypothetical protein
MFNRLIINYTFKFKKTKVFIIFKAYFNNKISIKVNILSFKIIYLYKEKDFNKKNISPLNNI